jgi:hypothetical protein
MSQVGTILKHSRTDIRLTGTQQGIGGKPANVLFIYTGEVGRKFVSASPNTFAEQLSIVLPDSNIGLGQIINPPRADHLSHELERERCILCRCRE